MSKQNSRQIDMLHGSILDKILFFALPLAASSILQQLFNSADVAVAGKFAGNQAQAAVGVNGPVINLLINLFVGLSVGANVVAARYIGEKREEAVRETAHTVISLALLSGFLLLAVGQMAARPILSLIGTPGDVIGLAVVYLRIYFLGMPFIMLYNFGSALLRSVGDTRRPLYCLAVSGLLNVALNLLLVIVFHLSAAGVAIATVISNAVSAGMVLRILTRSEELIHVDLKKLTFHREHLLRIVQIGVPAGIQGVVFSLSNVCIQSAVNSFGSNAIAGSADAVNFESFTYFVTSAFSQAAVTFTSQNYGAGEYERCKRIFRLSITAGMAITFLMSVTFVLGRNYVIQFFSSDPAVIHYALIRILHAELFACLPVTYEVSAGALRGMGHSMLPAALTVVGSCGLRFVWVYTVFKRVGTFEALMNVYPVTWAITGAMVLAAYLLTRRRALSETLPQPRPFGEPRLQAQRG